MTTMINEKCLCYQTRAVSRLVTKFYDEYFKSSGLTPSQFHILCQLDKEDSIFINSLSVTLIMERTTLSKGLKLLNQKGLVEIAPSVEDNRRRMCVITTAGKEAITKCTPYWELAQKSVEALAQTYVGSPFRLSELLLDQFRDKMTQVINVLHIDDLTRNKEVKRKPKS